MATNGYVNGQSNDNHVTNGLNGHHINNNQHPNKERPYSRLYDPNAPPDILQLKADCSQTTNPADYPHSSSIHSNIPIYNLSTFQSTDSETVTTLQEEWHHILHLGPGVFVLQNFCPSTSIPLLDKVNRVFDSIITTESQSLTHKSKGDHFAAANTNSRIWNSLQKHALADPSSFTEYYSNPWLRHVSESWLGPAYTITAQVNIVRPGGAPQMPHRDYHLGFQTPSDTAQWPKTMHATSQFLTLQGAIAHSNMPLSSGPTRLLPFSQLLPTGYLAWRSEPIKSYFAANWVSLPLSKGDALFFNPALIHAAGENVTAPPNGIDRSANLLQISSAFGKTMEKIDFEAMVLACWECLVEMAEGQGDEDGSAVDCAVRAMTDGYPFPTNLDRRVPAPGGMAPESMTDLVMKAVKERRPRDEVEAILRVYREDSSA